jgi:hypothetical protein
MRTSPIIRVVAILLGTVDLAVSFTYAARRITSHGKEAAPANFTFTPIPPNVPRSQSRWGSPSESASSSPGRGQHRGGATKRRRSKASGTVEASANWCGATLSTTADDPISSVFAYFQTPNLSLVDSEAAPQYAAAWVGIDGASCQSAMVQAGVTTVVSLCFLCLITDSITYLTQSIMPGQLRRRKQRNSVVPVDA